MGIRPSLWLLRDSRWPRLHVQLAWSVFGANLVVTAATGLTSNGRCPCVPLTWWTTIRKNLFDTLANNSVDVVLGDVGYA